MKTDAYHVGIGNSTITLEEEETTEQEPCENQTQQWHIWI